MKQRPDESNQSRQHDQSLLIYESLDLPDIEISGGPQGRPIAGTGRM